MPSPSATAAPPPVTPREMRLLGLLVCVGVAGAAIAYLQFTRLRIELDTTRQEQARELARLRTDNQKLEQRQKEQVLAAEAAHALPAIASGPAESFPISRAERMAVLLSLAKTLSLGSNPSLARFEAQFMELRAQLTALRPQSGPRPEIPSAAYVLSESGQLPPRFEELFMLSAGQSAELRGALAATEAKVDELTTANSRIKDNGNGTYTLETAGVPESEIAAARTRLVATFRETLGDDGYQAFALLNGGAVGDTPNFFARLYNSFGTLGLSATISKAPRGSYRFEMKTDKGGSGSGGGTTLDQLKPRLGAGVKLLPSGF